MRRLVQGARDERAPDPALAKLIARGSNIRDVMLCEGLSMRDLAQRENVTGPYICRVIWLAFLAPEIVSAILQGRQPHDLTAEKLVRDSRTPLSWAEQRRQPGFGYRANGAPSSISTRFASRSSRRRCRPVTRSM